ncbi:RE1-silencing transcription factor [Hypomesus transpacificus]|uniref:RE1-silencing transcription factor n=1 Tax=Hypomesus transpacificus TaxID=137520 RepID=UPI001F07A149|nr:RE1-silencing transcription factor [Hypomesus transpacificus]
MEFANRIGPSKDLKSHLAKMRFYCFYCNHLSHSNSDLSQHLVQKHSIFPFKCQLCDYGALKKDSIMQHVRQIHTPSMNVTPLKLDRRNVSVSNTPPILSSTSTSVSPFAGTTASCSKPFVARFDKAGHLSETVRANPSPKVQTGLLAPLREQLEKNQPLTVSVPNEVTIPAGCFVELIEVKTVNGKKELKLRRVPQTPSGSLAKASKCATSKNAATVKSSLVSNTILNRKCSGSDGTCAANQLTLKRKNLEQLHAPRTASDLGKQSTHLQTPNPSQGINSSEIKEEMMKEEDLVLCPKMQHLTPVKSVSPSLNFKFETNTESSNMNFPTDPPPNNQLKEEKNSSFSESLLKETISEENLLDDNITGQEAFPVISCVFSLSRQSEDLQGCSQPMWMALQKIAMGNSSLPSLKTSLIHEKQTLALVTTQKEDMKTGNNDNNGYIKELPPVHDQNILAKAGERADQVQSEKTEELSKHMETQTVNYLCVKDEQSVKAGGLSVSFPQCTTNKQDTCPRLSSYLTISLKRIRLNDNKTTNQSIRKQLHLRLEKRKKQWKVSSIRRLTHRVDTSGNFISLKVDQLVKHPAQNQPVVVLNHPNPQALRKKTETERVNGTSDSKVIPTCHILKMKLNKVMGQKYEVMGCTVRVYP